MTESRGSAIGSDVLAAAAASGRWVLVQVSASWCPYRSALDRVPERGIEWLDRRVVRTRAQSAEESGSEGFAIEASPTSILLDADGQERARTVESDPERLLDWVAANTPGGTSDAPPRTARGDGALGSVQGRELVRSVARTLRTGFDRSHGGFGTGQKFPHPEALDFAILYYAKTQDAAYAELVQRSLEEMAKGGLFDQVSGGFFRYCKTRDWRHPDTEIRLETQAGLLRNYLEAAQLFDRPDFLRVARKILTYLENHLDDRSSGLWFGSQDADAEYYALDEVRRADRKAPPVECNCYTASVAQCVSSLFKAASVLGERALHDRARRGIDALMERCYRPGKGMFHRYDGSSPQMLGMLTDQAYTARALLHAFQHTEDSTYLRLAEDLLDGVLHKQTRRRGDFSDFAEDDPKYRSSRTQNSTLQDNGIAAEALLRASVLCGRPDYRTAAERALLAFAPDHALYGYFSATFGRALELWIEPPLEVVVVGARGDPGRSELLATAHRTYVPSKLVSAVDPGTEAERCERLGLKAGERATAFVNLERCCVVRTEDPAQLAAAMQRAERLRSRH